MGQGKMISHEGHHHHYDMGYRTKEEPQLNRSSNFHYHFGDDEVEGIEGACGPECYEDCEWVKLPSREPYTGWNNSWVPRA